jgi:hypothetical protein
VQTQQSIALFNGMEKVLGKGGLFAYVVCLFKPEHFNSFDRL